MIAEYVTAGRVRLEYRDFAFLGEESTRAAVGAACALDQGAFWRYHDTLYANQAGENGGAFADDRLRRMAGALGLDEDAFATCLDDPAHETAVAAMADEARAAGLRQTPSFVVDGRIVEGGAYEPLAAAIETALGERP